MAFDPNEIGRTRVTNSNRDGDLSRTISELRDRVDQIERMRGNAFGLGVVRISFMLPEIGVKTSF